MSSQQPPYQPPDQPPAQPPAGPPSAPPPPPPPPPAAEGQPYQQPGAPVPDWAPYYGASFGVAFQRFWRKYADFTGRASRSELWWWVLAWVVIEARDQHHRERDRPDGRGHVPERRVPLDARLLVLRRARRAVAGSRRSCRGSRSRGDACTTRTSPGRSSSCRSSRSWASSSCWCCSCCRRTRRAHGSTGHGPTLRRPRRTRLLTRCAARIRLRPDARV